MEKMSEIAVVKEICNGLLEKGKLVRVRIQGTCMTGFIDDGETVLIAPDAISHIRVGDIIVFFNGSHLVCHRVISKQPINGQIALIAKGDNHYNTVLVTEENLIGVVVTVEKPYSLVDLTNLRWRIVNMIVAFYMRTAYLLLLPGRYVKHHWLNDNFNSAVRIASKASFGLMRLGTCILLFLSRCFLRL